MGARPLVARPAMNLGMLEHVDLDGSATTAWPCGADKNRMVGSGLGPNTYAAASSHPKTFYFRPYVLTGTFRGGLHSTDATHSIRSSSDPAFALGLDIPAAVGCRAAFGQLTT